MESVSPISLARSRARARPAASCIPVEDYGRHSVLEPVQTDVMVHQRKHIHLISDVQGARYCASHSDPKATQMR